MVVHFILSFANSLKMYLVMEFYFSLFHLCCCCYYSTCTCLTWWIHLKSNVWHGPSSMMSNNANSKKNNSTIHSTKIKTTTTKIEQWKNQHINQIKFYQSTLLLCRLYEYRGKNWIRWSLFFGCCCHLRLNQIFKVLRCDVMLISITWTWPKMWIYWLHSMDWDQ